MCKKGIKLKVVEVVVDVKVNVEVEKKGFVC